MRARDTVTRWVDRWLTTAAPGSRLPKDRELALLCGSSVMTVRRVLGEYARKGRIERVHGRGSGVPASVPADIRAEPARPSYESLTEHLTASIVKGELRAGDPLPAQKSLRYAFGVSPTTVLAAYRRLCRLGLATQVGRSYRVGSFLSAVRSPRYDRVWMFYHDEQELESLFSTGEAALALRAMETELVAFGRTLCLTQMRDAGRLAAQWRRDGEKPAALVFAGWDNPARGSGQLQALLELFDRMIGPATEGRIPALVITTNTMVKHPGVSYLSLSHATTVVRRLLAHCLCGGPYDSALFLFDESRAGLGRLLIDAIRMLPEVRALKPHMPFRYVIVPENKRRTMRSFFERTYAQAGRGHFEDRLSKYEPLGVDAFESATTIVPVLTRALRARTQPSLWVANDDQTAAEALAWCRQRGIDVPGKVALVSLEDNPCYRHLGIAACVHDSGRAGYLMAHALIGDIPIARTSRGFIGTSALLMPRLTLSTSTLGGLWNTG